MAEPSPTIACPNCGKQYRWKPELAGRKTQCTGCQQKMRLPQKPGDAVEAVGGLLREQSKESAGAYELAMDDGHDDPHLDAKAGRTGGAPAPPRTSPGNCPACNSRLKPGAVICINCGFNLAKGTKIKTAVATDAGDGGGIPTQPLDTGRFAAAVALGGRTAQIDQDEHKSGLPDNIRDYWVPIPLILLGFAAAVLQQVMFSDDPYGPVAAVIATIVELLIYVPLLLLALYVAAKALEIGFGSLWTGLLKLTAIVLGPSAFGTIIGIALTPLTGDISGWIIGWFVSLLIYWGLLQYLFRLDFSETFWLVIIIWFVRFIANLILGIVLLTILAMFMP